MSSQTIYITDESSGPIAVVETQEGVILVTEAIPVYSAAEYAAQSAASAAEALASEQAAAASEANALASEQAAAASEANAAASESSAAASAATATTQAGIATTQAGIATTKAGEASASAGAAAASASVANASELAAASSASAASASQTAAAGSALAASNSAGAAAASEAAALASEQASATSEANAAISEANAAASAAAAATTTETLVEGGTLDASFASLKSAGDIVLAGTRKFYLDGVGGVGGDTYITESASNQMDFFAGAVNALRLTAAGVAVVGTLSATANIKTADGAAFAWGNTTTYLLGSSAGNTLGAYVASTKIWEIDGSGLTTFSYPVAVTGNFSVTGTISHNVAGVDANLKLGTQGSLPGVWSINDANSAYTDLRIDGAVVRINSFSGGSTAVTGTLSATQDIATDRSVRFPTSYLGSASDYYVSRYLTNLVYNAPVGSGHNWAVANGDKMTLTTSLLTTASGVIASILDTTEATGTTAASLKTAGGLGVAKTLRVGLDTYTSGTFYAAGGNNTIALRSTNVSTGYTAIQLTNLGGNAIFGMENSTGGNNLIVGASGYDTILRGPLGIAFSADNGAGMQMRLASTGLSVYQPVGNAGLTAVATSAGVGATQITCEGYPNAYGAGIMMASRTSIGGTLIPMAKIVADGTSSWNTTASTQDAQLSVHVATDGVLTQVGYWNTSGLVIAGFFRATAGAGGDVGVFTGSAVGSRAGYIYADANYAAFGDTGSLAGTHFIADKTNTQMIFQVGNAVKGYWKTDGLALNATQKLYLDGGSNTYLVEGSADTIDIYAGGLKQAWVTTAYQFGIGDRLALKRSNFGYSATYGVLQLGLLGSNAAISLGVDVSGNPSGGFTGNEIILPHSKNFIAPNAANTAFNVVMSVGTDGGLTLPNTLTVGNATSAFIKEARYSELLAGADVGGFYYCTGFGINPAKPIFIGNTGTTEMRQSVGTGALFNFYTAGSIKASIGADRLAINSTAKLYLDGAAATGDTYITESASNVLDLYAGGTKALSLTATSATLTAAQSTLQQTSSTGTNPVVHAMTNSGGTYYVGVNDSAAVQFGGTAYSLVNYAPAGRVLEQVVGGTGVITRTNSAGMTVFGITDSSDVTATSGSVGLRIRYSASDFLNIFGSMYSSGATMLGYGVRSSSAAANTFLSTSAAASHPRGALTMDNTLRFFQANASTLAVGATASLTETFTITSNGDLITLATKKHYLDGGGDTYLVESSANVLDLYASGVNTLRLTGTGAAVTGTFSASGITTLGAATNEGVTGQAYTGAGAWCLYSRAITPGATNYAFLTNGSSAEINGTAKSKMSVAGVVIAEAASTGFAVLDTTDATSTTAASLKTAGGLGVAKKSYFGDDLVISGSGILLKGNAGAGSYTEIPAGAIKAYNIYSSSTVPKTKIYSTTGATTNTGELLFATSGDGVNLTDALAIKDNSNIGIRAAAKLYLDGVAATGDTYLVESSANILDLYAGGTRAARFGASSVTFGAAIDVPYSVFNTAGGGLSKVAYFTSANSIFFSGTTAFYINDSANTKNIVAVKDAAPNNALIVNTAGISVPKTAGKGIQVDEAWSWRDLEGPIQPKASGAGSPAWTTWSGNIKEWAFILNDIVDSKFHWPHDWVPGTDVYIHVHWSHNGSAISGTFTVDHRHKWGKGHGQAVYDAEKTIQTTASITNITTHPALTTFITEVQLSAASPSASQIDTDNLEADGLLKISSIVSALPTVTGGSLFIEYIDIHYQSSNVGTKNKAPNFHA